MRRVGRSRVLRPGSCGDRAEGWHAMRTPLIATPPPRSYLEFFGALAAMVAIAVLLERVVTGAT